MQGIFRKCLIGTVLALGVGVAFAAAPDAVLGTWKLNVAKSTFSPGPAPKAQTRTYKESAQGVTLTVTTTGADGKDTAQSLTFKYDGKASPVTGSPDFDSVAVTRVDAMTVTSVQTKAGATVGTGKRTTSADGKTLTFAQKGTHADGKKFDDVLVYDKQ